MELVREIEVYHRETNQLGDMVVQRKGEDRIAAVEYAVEALLGMADTFDWDAFQQIKPIEFKFAPGPKTTSLRR